MHTRLGKWGFWVSGALSMRALDVIAHHHDLGTAVASLLLALAFLLVFWKEPPK